MPDCSTARPLRLSRSGVSLLLGAALLIAACTPTGEPGAMNGDTTADFPAFDTLTVRHVEDTARVRATPPPPVPRLGQAADSLSEYMTFLATFQGTFVAASRAQRLLLDIGRFDGKLGTPALERAYHEAVRVLAPVRIGDRFRLRGPWGASDAVVTGYDLWNGRIVATLDVPHPVDSLARRKETLVALALPTDSAAPAMADSCARDSVSAALAPRIAAVRDSLAQLLQSDTVTTPKPLLKSRRLRATQAVGCFGAARVMLFVYASAGGDQYTREYAVLVDTAGQVTPLRVRDIRFRIHEAIRAFDADGDGVDDIAVLGRAPRIGGTVVLKLDPAKKRLEYVMSGFSWESF